MPQDNTTRTLICEDELWLNEVIGDKEIYEVLKILQEWAFISHGYPTYVLRSWNWLRPTFFDNIKWNISINRFSKLRTWWYLLCREHEGKSYHRPYNFDTYELSKKWQDFITEYEENLTSQSQVVSISWVCHETANEVYDLWSYETLTPMKI